MTLDETIHPMGTLGTAERNEHNRLFLAWLEPDGRARRDVQAHPICAAPVESQGAIDLEEMGVRANLYRAIAGIRNDDLDRGAPGVEYDFAVLDEVIRGASGQDVVLSDLAALAVVVAVRERRS